MNVVDLKRKWFRECAENDPDRYRYILGHDCPEMWGLPSFGDVRTCADHTCDQCWEEALGGRADE